VTPRLDPLPKERWDEEARTALQGFVGAEMAERFLSDDPDAPRIPNVVGTFMHHPRLAGRWLAYSNVLLREPVLDPRLRELVVLRVAWWTRSEYEWVQHVRMAAGCGISNDEVEAIADGAGAGGWSPLEADLLTATDQLLDRYRIDDETWAGLAAHLDERQLVEVVFVVGSYACLAMAFNSFGLELDPELLPIRDTAPPLPA
jgi:4-carboxymuconolactone decarboxylase